MIETSGNRTQLSEPLLSKYIDRLNPKEEDKIEKAVVMYLNEGNSLDKLGVTSLSQLVHCIGLRFCQNIKHITMNKLTGYHHSKAKCFRSIINDFLSLNTLEIRKEELSKIESFCKDFNFNSKSDENSSTTKNRQPYLIYIYNHLPQTVLAPTLLKERVEKALSKI